MNKHTLQYVRGPSRSIDTQLSSCIAVNGDKGILNVYAQGTVVSIEESSVTLSNVKLYNLNENVLISNGDIILTLDSLKVTITPSLVEIYDIKIGTQPTLLLHIKDSRDTVTITAGGFSRLPEYTNQAVNTVIKIDELIASTESNKEVLALFAEWKHFLGKIEYSKGLIIPIDSTRDSLNSLLSEAKNKISMLIEANPYRFKSDSIDISSLQTERVGLRTYLIDCLNNNSEPLVILKARLSSIAEATIKTRVLFNQCEVRIYDPNTVFDSSQLLDKLDHLNCYVTSEYIEKNALHDYLPRFGSEDKYVYLLGKVSTYIRNSYRASQYETSAADIGINLINYSPVPSLVNELLSYLPQWEELIRKEGTLVGTGELTKKISKRMEKINTYSSEYINTNETTRHQLDKMIAGLNVRYEICMLKRAELVSQQQEEEVQAKLQAGLEFLLELTEEAIAYFRTGQLI